MKTSLPYITKNKVGRGAAYLYVENIIGIISAYIFWIVISRLTSPDVVGVSAAVVSSAAIVTTVVNMGIPISIERFLGRAFGTHQTENLRLYIESSILILAISITVTSVVILFAGNLISATVNSLDFNSSLILLTLIIIVSSSVSRLFRGIIIASLNTKILAITMACSTAAKFALAAGLLLLGLGAVGLTIGIASFTVLEAIMMVPSIRRILNTTSDGNSHITIRKSARELLVGGLPSWIPSLLSTLGSQLGTLVVFGSNGASQAAFYFISLSIYTAIQTGLGVLFTIMYPVLSSLDKGRERLSERTIRIGLLTTVPLSYSMIFYADNILSFFGDVYIQGSSALQILLLSIMPVALLTGISNHVYALGKYRQTLVIGIASSLPRAILYFILVPSLGSTGAAISFTAGSVTGLLTSLIIAKNVDIKIKWKQNLIFCLVPLFLSFIFNIFEINIIIGMSLSIVLSYAIYLKIHIMTKKDLHDFLIILPEGIAKPLGRLLDSLKKDKGAIS